MKIVTVRGLYRLFELTEGDHAGREENAGQRIMRLHQRCLSPGKSHAAISEQRMDRWIRLAE